MYCMLMSFLGEKLGKAGVIGKICILVPLSYGICEISRGIFLMLVSGLIHLSEAQKRRLGWVIYWVFIEVILAYGR